MQVNQKVIKKEVIDLADTMDLLAEVINRQEQSINEIKTIIKN